MPLSQSAVLSNVAQNAASVEVKPYGGVNGFVIYNDSAADLYLRPGSTAASLTSYTWKIPAGGYLQEPDSHWLYVGAIQGIWSAAGAGAARVTLFGP